MMSILRIQGYVEGFKNRNYLSFFIKDDSGKNYYCYSKQKFTKYLSINDRLILFGK